MAKSEPSWNPWGKKTKHTDELLKSFGRQCRLHMEAELQQMIAREREKVSMYPSWQHPYVSHLKKDFFST
jgi:hypothetical protein